jgi:hypothetical protein
LIYIATPLVIAITDTPPLLTFGLPEKLMEEGLVGYRTSLEDISRELLAITAQSVGGRKRTQLLEEFLWKLIISMEIIAIMHLKICALYVPIVTPLLRPFEV